MAETEPSRSDRVNIDDSVAPIYKQLVDGSNNEEAPFRTMKDVFMFAALLGYRQGRRRSLSTGKKITIRRDVLTENDFTLLKTLALAETSDVNVLQDLGKILTIAEEYAHAGIHELKAYLLDQGGQPLWNLVELVNNK